MNYFDFFDLPVKFNPDETILKSKYQSYLKDNHPDFFVNDPEKYKEALQNASFNNEAYRTLNDFYKRCRYVLDIYKYEAPDKLPSLYLMQMMEINEQIEELRENKDQAKWESLQREINDLSLKIEADLIKLTKTADEKDELELKPLVAIHENLLKHKYILRLKETLANFAAL